MMTRNTAPDDETRKADHETDVAHTADRAPTQEESRAAEAYSAGRDPGESRSVAEHEKDMMESGANVKGEGAIE